MKASNGVVKLPENGVADCVVSFEGPLILCSFMFWLVVMLQKETRHSTEPDAPPISAEWLNIWQNDVIIWYLFILCETQEGRREIISAHEF